MDENLRRMLREIDESSAIWIEPTDELILEVDSDRRDWIQSVARLYEALIVDSAERGDERAAAEWLRQALKFNDMATVQPLLFTGAANVANRVGLARATLLALYMLNPGKGETLASAAAELFDNRRGFDYYLAGEPVQAYLEVSAYPDESLEKLTNNPLPLAFDYTNSEHLKEFRYVIVEHLLRAVEASRESPEAVSEVAELRDQEVTSSNALFNRPLQPMLIVYPLLEGPNWVFEQTAHLDELFAEIARQLGQGKTMQTLEGRSGGQRIEQGTLLYQPVPEGFIIGLELRGNGLEKPLPEDPRDFDSPDEDLAMLVRTG